ncbi:unnamed protein product [Symbiodinium microadriaticum]|nr:unnamed protein product [Symbiodinium microadriaticum]
MPRIGVRNADALFPSGVVGVLLQPHWDDAHVYAEGIVVVAVVFRNGLPPPEPVRHAREIAVQRRSLLEITINIGNYSLHLLTGKVPVTNQCGSNAALVAKELPVVVLEGSTTKLSPQSRVIGSFRPCFQTLEEAEVSEKSALEKRRMVIDTEDGCYIPACGSGQVKCLKNLRNEAFPTTIVKAIASDVEPESSLLDAAEEAVEEVLQFAPEDTRLMANIIRDYIRAGEYSWASTLEQRWLARDGGAHSVRGKPVAKYASLRHSKQRTQAEMWLSCTDIEKVDRWALVAFVRACVESGELQIADNWTRKLLKIADSGKLQKMGRRRKGRAGVVDSDSASRQKEAEDNLVALVAARATLAKGAEIEGVRRWLHRMQRVGIQPSWPVYGRLLQGYAEADKSKDFEELLKEMQAVRVRPRAEAFNHLIKAKVDRHSMDAAADWMQRMAEFRSTPNAATYRMLITSSAVSSSASEAEGWLVAMYQSRLHVPESCART